MKEFQKGDVVLWESDVTGAKATCIVVEVYINKLRCINWSDLEDRKFIDKDDIERFRHLTPLEKAML
jgi:hypothetical protein